MPTPRPRGDVYRCYIAQYENKVYIGKTNLVNVEHRREAHLYRQKHRLKHHKGSGSIAAAEIFPYEGHTIKFIDPLPYSHKGNEERDLILKYKRDYRYICLNKLVPWDAVLSKPDRYRLAKQQKNQKSYWPQKLEFRHEQLRGLNLRPPPMGS